MKYLFTAILILFAVQVFSQADLSYPPERWQEGKRTGLKIDPSKSANQPKIVIVAPGVYPERMPTQRIENKGVFQYNNGKGFDVYRMKIDNMPCLVPDSTFQSYLPGARTSKKSNLVKRP